MFNNFDLDMVTADKVEVEVIKKLQKVNPEFIFNGFSGTKGYDATYTINGKVYHLEIKSDYYTATTGNIVIEYESRGKASGIATSKAHMWAYTVMRTLEDFDIYLINTEKLRQMIDNEVYYDKIIGGDPLSNTKMYKFKLEDFKNYCKVV